MNIERMFIMAARIAVIRGRWKDWLDQPVIGNYLREMNSRSGEGERKAVPQAKIDIGKFMSKGDPKTQEEKLRSLLSDLSKKTSEPEAAEVLIGLFDEFNSGTESVIHGLESEDSHGERIKKL